MLNKKEILIIEEFVLHPEGSKYSHIHLVENDKATGNETITIPVFAKQTEDGIYLVTEDRMRYYGKLRLHQLRYNAFNLLRIHEMVEKDEDKKGKEVKKELCEPSSTASTSPKASAKKRKLHPRSSRSTAEM